MDGSEQGHIRRSFSLLSGVGVCCLRPKSWATALTTRVARAIARGVLAVNSSGVEGSILYRIGGWIRLAVVLSALWIVGIGLYAAYAWFHAAAVDSPFVSYVLPAGNGHEFLVPRVPGPGVTYLQTPQPRFHWPWFLTVVGGGLAGIWVLTMGPVWVVKAFRQQAPPTPQDPARHPERRG
jgi:hypothetical protein